MSETQKNTPNLDYTDHLSVLNDPEFQHDLDAANTRLALIDGDTDADAVRQEVCIDMTGHLPDGYEQWIANVVALSYRLGDRNEQIGEKDFVVLSRVPWIGVEVISIEGVEQVGFVFVSGEPIDIDGDEIMQEVTYGVIPQPTDVWQFNLLNDDTNFREFEDAYAEVQQLVKQSMQLVRSREFLISTPDMQRNMLNEMIYRIKHTLRHFINLHPDESLACGSWRYSRLPDGVPVKKLASYAYEGSDDTRPVFLEGNQIDIVYPELVGVTAPHFKRRTDFRLGGGVPFLTIDSEDQDYSLWIPLDTIDSLIKITEVPPKTDDEAL